MYANQLPTLNGPPVAFLSDVNGTLEHGGLWIPGLGEVTHQLREGGTVVAMVTNNPPYVVPSMREKAGDIFGTKLSGNPADKVGSAFRSWTSVPWIGVAALSTGSTFTSAFADDGVLDLLPMSVNETEGLFRLIETNLKNIGLVELVTAYRSDEGSEIKWKLVKAFPNPNEAELNAVTQGSPWEAEMLYVLGHDPRVTEEKTIQLADLERMFRADLVLKSVVGLTEEAQRQGQLSNQIQEQFSGAGFSTIWEQDLGHTTRAGVHKGFAAAHIAGSWPGGLDLSLSIGAGNSEVDGPLGIEITKRGGIFLLIGPSFESVFSQQVTKLHGYPDYERVVVVQDFRQVPTILKALSGFKS